MSNSLVFEIATDWVKPGLLIFAGAAISYWSTRRQATAQQHRYKKVIYLELEDIQSMLMTRVNVLGKIIDLFAHDKYDGSTPIKVNHPIHDKYYAECALLFSEDERLSFGHVYEHVRDFNSAVEALREQRNFRNPDESIDAIKHRKFLDETAQLFIRTSVTCGMVRLQLEQRDKFEIRSEANVEAVNQAELTALAELQKLLGNKAGQSDAFKRPL